MIREDFDPQKIAAEYADNGATALSVLTDEAYFQGCDRYLQQARQVAELPVLRKDFTVDEYQIYEARVLGADAILIIVALMDGGQLRDFAGLAREQGLTALVEVHTTDELDRALEQPLELVGINNRDLTTFETSLETTFQLLPLIPMVSRPSARAGSTLVKISTGSKRPGSTPFSWANRSCASATSVPR